MTFDVKCVCSTLVLAGIVFLLVKGDPTALEYTDFELKNQDSNFEKVFKYVIDTCKIKERASDNDVENIVNNFLPSTMTEKCFVACWLESFHVIKNRRFYRDQYVKLSTYGQNSDNNTNNVLRQILQGCKLHDTCKQHRCEIAFRIMKCIYDGAMKSNVDPKTL